MIKAATLVVEGTVIEVSPGRTGGESLRFARARLRVDASLIGEAPAGPVLLEQLVEDGGKPLVVDGVRHAQVGDHGIYFLQLDRIDGEPIYGLLNNQSQYIVEAGGSLTGSDVRDDLVQQLNRLSIADLRAAIRENVPS